MKWHRPSTGGAAAWIALLSLLCSFATIDAVSASSREGVIHGPPTLSSDPAGSIVVGYIATPSAGADLHAWLLGDPSPGSGWKDREVGICMAPGDQLHPAAACDGSGGRIVVWEDFRNGHDLDIYAQHVLASGTIDPSWPREGLAVCVASGAQVQPRIVFDGEGGALVIWEDRRSGEDDVFLQHVRANGMNDPAWPAGGRSLGSGAGARMNAAVIPDGSGGAIVAWQQQGDATGFDILALHVLPNGHESPGWPLEGRVVGGASGDQIEPTLAPDGAGGCIVVWSDDGNPEATRLFAQRILASGEPDARWPEAGIALCDAKRAQHQPSLLIDGAGGAFIAWQQRSAETGESNVVVQHVTENGIVDSDWPEEGLHASTAGGFQVSPRLAMVSDALSLVWLDRRDVAHVRAYAQRILRHGVLDPSWPEEGTLLSRDPADDLVLGASASDAALAVWREPGSWQVRSLRLTAAPPVLDAPPARTELLAPRPNPAAGAVTFRFTLATRQRARLTVFDIQGRRVATPMDRSLEPGPHEVVWDRRSARGALAANGVYFVRFDADDRRSSKRFVLSR
jgi:hypothetical protein